MTHKYDRSLEALKNESTRQRWALFHRAIASAKLSNTEAMRQAEEAQAVGDVAVAPDGKAEERGEPQLSVARWRAS